MRIIGHDILGIRDNGAINELVVIRIRLNQPETELGIHANDVVRPKNGLDHHPSDDGRRMARKDLLVLVENFSRYAQLVSSLDKITPDRIEPAAPRDRLQQAIRIKDNATTSDSRLRQDIMFTTSY